jgi:hypothetical protein
MRSLRPESAYRAVSTGLDVLAAFRRIEPMSLSAYPFCHGERGAIGRSRMLMARTR